MAMVRKIKLLHKTSTWCNSLLSNSDGQTSKPASSISILFRIITMVRLATVSFHANHRIHLLSAIRVKTVRASNKHSPLSTSPTILMCPCRSRKSQIASLVLVLVRMPAVLPSSSLSCDVTFWIKQWVTSATSWTRARSTIVTTRWIVAQTEALSTERTVVALPLVIEWAALSS